MALDGTQAHGGPATTQDEIVKQLVHVNLIRFVEVDARGRDADRPAAIGYIVYNAKFQEFGQWSFDKSDDYTLESDVYDQIRTKHPRLAPYVDAFKGFYMSGNWCVLSDDQQVIH